LRRKRGAFTMSFRMIEVVIPQARAQRLRGLLQDVELVGFWQQELVDDLAMLRLLVRGNEVEALVDALEPHCAGDQRARIILLPVEATVPRLPEPDEEDPSTGGNEKARQPGGRIWREEIVTDLAGAAEVSSTYVAFTILATVVAAVGLLRNNVAIIIGAMVIAPLLSPNMALALATTLGDPGMIRRAATTAFVGFGIALLGSLMLGVVFTVDPSSPEIAARASVDLADVALALASGVAGALAVTSGMASGLIGVMVAVALMPPLVVVGLLLGAGEIRAAGDAFTLLGTNVICVNLAGVVTFAVRGIRPRNWWEAGRARSATRRAIALWTLLLLFLIVLLVKSRRDLGL
jgi:uncharacterized hydrophobic protein (TIGR00341 family)